MGQNSSYIKYIQKYDYDDDDEYDIETDDDEYDDDDDDDEYDDDDYHTIQLYAILHGYKETRYYDGLDVNIRQYSFSSYSIYDTQNKPYVFAGYCIDTQISPLSWCAVYTNDWQDLYYTGALMNGKAYKMTDTQKQHCFKFTRRVKFYPEEPCCEKYDAVLFLPKQYNYSHLE